MKACIKHTPKLVAVEDEYGREFKVVCAVCGEQAVADDHWYARLHFKSEKVK